MQARKQFFTQRGRVAMGLALALLAGLILAFPTIVHGREPEVPPPTRDSSIQVWHALDLIKSATPDPVLAGAPLSYSLFYTVTGTGIAPSVILTDVVPANTTFMSCSPEPCGEASGVVTWALGNISPGGYQVALTVLVDSPLLSGTLLFNAAWISDQDGYRAAATTTTTVNSEPGLTVSKSVAPWAVRPGSTVTYTISVTNEGLGPVTGVNIIDDLPPGFYPSIREWANQTITNRWMRDFGATTSWTDGIYWNQVTVTRESNVYTATTAPVLVDGTPPDSVITFLPDITNQSPIPISWSTLDMYPGSGVEQTCLWYQVEGTVPWTPSGLCSAGANGTFSFTPPPGSSGRFHFQTLAVDRVGNMEPQPTGNSTYRTLFDPYPPHSRAYSPGSSWLDVAIEVTWIATDTLSGVDTVALWYRFESGAWQHSGLSSSGLSGSVVSGTFAFEPANGPGTYYFESIATDAAGNVEARIGGPGDTATRVLADVRFFVYLPIVLKAHILPMPDLSTSSKTAARDIVEPGQAVTYTIVLRNSGSLRADFVFYDPLPAQTSFESVSPPCTYHAGENRIQWSGSLAAGGTGSCHYSLRVNSGASGVILNTAQVYDGYHAQPVVLSTEVALPAWHRGQGLPVGDTVYSLASCPTACNILYAGTAQHGVWKSWDGGTSWSMAGLAGQMVRGVALAPGSSCQVVYATTWGNGIWKSTDGAASWLATNNGLTDLYLYAVAAADAGTVYLGTSAAGVYKSQDGGMTWTSSSTGLPEAATIHTLVIRPTIPSSLYAGTWGSGVYQSEDGAHSWSAMNAGLPTPTNVYGFASHPAGTGGAYVATEQSGVYRWIGLYDYWHSDWDGGRTAYSVALAGDDTAYLGTDGQVDGNGLWRKLAGTWQPMPTQPGTNPVVRSIVVPPSACGPERLLWTGTTTGAWWYGVE